jgi:hypothetical protein
MINVLKLLYYLLKVLQSSLLFHRMLCSNNSIYYPERQNWLRNKPELQFYWEWSQRQVNLDLLPQELAICGGGNPSAYPNSHLVHNTHWKQKTLTYPNNTNYLEYDYVIRTVEIINYQLCL